MIYIVLGVLAIIFVWFYNDMTEKNAKIQSLGGMKKKYEKIINVILSGDSDAKVHSIGKDYIVFGVNNYYGSVLFDLQENVDNTIKIKFSSKNDLFGEHKLEWSFNTNTDHDYIIQVIGSDITKSFERVTKTS